MENEKLGKLDVAYIREFTSILDTHCNKRKCCLCILKHYQACDGTPLKGAVVSRLAIAESRKSGVSISSLNYGLLSVEADIVIKEDAKNMAVSKPSNSSKEIVPYVMNVFKPKVQLNRRDRLRRRSQVREFIASRRREKKNASLKKKLATVNEVCDESDKSK
jgi:hypothetical protein